MTLMTVRKISVSLDENVVELARRAAEAQGKSLSAWLSDTAAHAARIQAGLRAVAEFEAEHGAFTEEELREADEALARLGIGRGRR
jgi:hypothetical protein